MNTKALRQKVLDLAIHGKLVPQNPNDESATVLLEKIRAEKAEKIKKGLPSGRRGELKADKKDSFIFVGSDKRHYEQFADGTVKDIEDEIPFDVPEGWAWCRLNQIYNFIDYRGVTPNKIDSGVPLVTAKNVKNGYIDYSISEFISKADYENRQGRGSPRKGDLLFTTEAPLGNCAIADLDIFSPGQRIITFQQYTNTEFLNNKLFLYFILSDKFQELIYNKRTGTTVTGIKAEKLKLIFIPLPPKKEQDSIVSVIENIYLHINSIEKSKLDLQEIIKQTKSKILDLAIHGKLVPQDPNDEPAEELLKRIATSDNRPYKKIEEEEPYELPSNWSWCFLGDICSKIKRGKSPKYVDKSSIMAFAQKCNHKDGPTSLEKALYIDESTLKKYPEEEKMQFNDIVINSTGTGTLGRVGIFNCSIPNDVNGVYPDSHVTTVRILPEIDKLYCYYFIKNKQSYLETMGEGSTNQKELKPDTISSLCFPLPPYPEQKRIVFKIEELFSSLETIVSNLD